MQPLNRLLAAERMIIFLRRPAQRACLA